MIRQQKSTKCWLFDPPFWSSRICVYISSGFLMNGKHCVFFSCSTGLLSTFHNRPVFTPWICTWPTIVQCLFRSKVPALSGSLCSMSDFNRCSCIVLLPKRRLEHPKKGHIPNIFIIWPTKIKMVMSQDSKPQKNYPNISKHAYSRKLDIWWAANLS